MHSIFRRQDRRRAPVPVYLILMAGQAVCFSLFFTVQLIYHVTIVGLDPFQMVLVGAVLEVIWLLCEIPTGVVADVYSRRRSILIGLALMGCSYTLEGSFPLFWTALLGQVFWGIGGTFTSGAIQAWITDEIGEAAAGPVFLRGEQARLAGGLTGTLLAVLLGLIHLQIPMVLAGIGMFLLTITLLVIMPERHRPVRTAGLSPMGQLVETTRAGVSVVIARPVARVLLLISLIAGLAAEAFDRLTVPYLINRFTFPAIFGKDDPVIWFGISSVIGSTLALATSELFKRSGGRALGPGTPARLLGLLAATEIAALVVFVLSGQLWLAFAMLWTRGMISTISEPVQAAWLNRHLDSATRATVISMTGQANSLGQATGGPALGWVGSRYSIRAALLCSSLILTPTVALFRRLAGNDREAAEMDAHPTPAD